MVFDLCEQTDRQTDILFTILRTAPDSEVTTYRSMVLVSYSKNNENFKLFLHCLFEDTPDSTVDKLLTHRLTTAQDKHKLT